MKIAAVILNYNSFEDCQRCVLSLRKQDIPLEIILVDNASQADDRKKLADFCEKEGLVLLCNSENRGYNAGNNTGLRFACEQGCHYALIANPDMDFSSSGYVRALAGKMESKSQFAVVASDILHIDGYHQNPFLPDGDWKGSFGWLFGVFKPTVQKGALFFCGDWKTSHECVKVSGCCFLIRLSFLKGIGFFDEYPRLYCEEAILAKQVNRASMKMYYLAEVQAVHRHIVKSKGKVNPRLRQFLRSRLYFIWKYSDEPWYGKILSSFSWICYLSSLMLFNVLRGR